MAENRVIGRENRLPWHLPADLRRFKRLTMGHALIMGRKTFETVGRPLPGRRTIILTRDPGYHAFGAEVVQSLDAALARVADDDEPFVAGGEHVYRLALPHADRIYLTVIHAEIPGDVHFPEFDDDAWQLVEDERFEPDARHRYPYSFRRYERRISER